MMSGKKREHDATDEKSIRLAAEQAVAEAQLKDNMLLQRMAFQLQMAAAQNAVLMMQGNLMTTPQSMIPFQNSSLGIGQPSPLLTLSTLPLMTVSSLPLATPVWPEPSLLTNFPDAAVVASSTPLQDQAQANSPGNIAKGPLLLGGAPLDAITEGPPACPVAMSYPGSDSGLSLSKRALESSREDCNVKALFDGHISTGTTIWPQLDSRKACYSFKQKALRESSNCQIEAIHDVPSGMATKVATTAEAAIDNVNGSSVSIRASPQHQGTNLQQLNDLEEESQLSLANFDDQKLLLLLLKKTQRQKRDTVAEEGFSISGRESTNNISSGLGPSFSLIRGNNNHRQQQQPTVQKNSIPEAAEEGQLKQQQSSSVVDYLSSQPPACNSNSTAYYTSRLEAESASGRCSPYLPSFPRKVQKKDKTKRKFSGNDKDTEEALITMMGYKSSKYNRVRRRRRGTEHNFRQQYQQGGGALNRKTL